jgi:dUTP pyrophosphatase
MEVKFKKLDIGAVLPSYAKEGDAGLDLTCIDWYVDDIGNFIYKTGLAVEIPTGYIGLIFPRSSIIKTSYMLANSVGVIDSGYRGEIRVVFKRPIDTYIGYKKGDRVAQLVIIPYPAIKPIFAEELSTSDRGEGGFGHTGK